jgi:hypothetical protein
MGVMSYEKITCQNDNSRTRTRQGMRVLPVRVQLFLHSLPSRLFDEEFPDSTKGVTKSIPISLRKATTAVHQHDNSIWHFSIPIRHLAHETWHSTGVMYLL